MDLLMTLDYANINRINIYGYVSEISQFSPFYLRTWAVGAGIFKPDFAIDWLLANA
tara:strand:- start:2564 stop:2731 length:168 start_codon:yes stop_codon:yes gene_type:complete